MCDRAIPKGYILKSGEKLLFTEIDPEEMPDAIREELNQSPASQLDILYIRRHLHQQGNYLQKLENNFTVLSEDLTKKFEELNDSLKKALYTKVKNGEEHERLIGELVAEMYEIDTGKRDFHKLKKLFKKYRGNLIVFFTLGVITAIIFRHFISDALEWIATHIIDLLHLIK